MFICAALHLLTVSCLQIILAKSQHIDRLLVVEESDSRTRRIEGRRISLLPGAINSYINCTFGSLHLQMSCVL